jgi:hypothetical protein
MRCHYWVWHNRRTEFVGFHHYRRAFLYRFLSVSERLRRAAATFSYTTQIVCEPEMFADYEAVLADRLPSLYDACIDIIIPRAIPLCAIEAAGLDARPGVYPNLMTQYREHHHVEDWEIFEEACRREGLETRLPFLVPYNMFVMRWPLFGLYMSLWWLIMSKIRIFPNDDLYQHRVHGFLSERLFTMWIADIRMRRPEVRIEEMPVLFRS